MNVLLSLRPQYAHAILRGTKIYELRRRVFRRSDVERVYIYATAPERRIIGHFRVGEVLEDEPVRLWDIVKNNAGVGSEQFFEYFGGVATAFAIRISTAYRFLEPLDPKDYLGRFQPPQSFSYLSEGSVLGRALTKHHYLPAQ